MNRRKVCSLSLAFVLGIATVKYQWVWLWCFLIGYSVWFLASVWYYGEKSIRLQWIWSIVFLCSIICGILAGGSHQQRERDFIGNENANCLVQGEIYQKVHKKDSYLYYLKNCKLQLNQTDDFNHRVLLYLSTGQYSVGEILCVKGKLKNFSISRNEGNYDEKRYYQGLNLDFKVIGETVIRTSGTKKVWKEFLYTLKEKWTVVYLNEMEKADAGMLIAMILGDKSFMEPTRKEMYQKVGLGHTYAISGLHISILGMALYRFLRKRGLPYSICCGMGALLIFAYGQMVGSSVSAERAMGMFFIYMYASYRGRSVDGMTSLSFMAAVLVGENPYLLEQGGFWLSFTAVLGVLVSKDLFEEKKERGIPSYLVKTLGVSVCIQCMIIPVMCQFFYEIPMYALIANVILLPFVGGLLGLGMLGGIIGSFAPAFGRILLLSCHWMLCLFDVVCEKLLELPHATLITGKMKPWEMFFWYGSIACIVLFHRYGSGVFIVLGHEPERKWKRWTFLGVLPLFVLLLFPGNTKTEITMLDVGQGDGIYIATGDGTNLFIDGGSSDVTMVGMYRILPFLKCRGVREIDYWFLSHCDKDHMSGLEELMALGYPIKTLVVAREMIADESWQELQTLAEKRHVNILKMGRQDAIKSEDWQMRCLAPSSKSVFSDKNENSLVLLYEGKFVTAFGDGEMEKKSMTAFFGGDIGEEQEQYLLQEYRLSQVDVYKVSHHGSKNSNSSKLLEKINPRIALISCGEGNSYGHPHEETLERLSDAGCRILTTAECGAVTVKFWSELEVNTWVKPPAERK